MDRICAVIDAQGYQIGDKFYIRELAVVPIDRAYSYSCGVTIPIPLQMLNHFDRLRCDYCYYHVHGLDWTVENDTNVVQYGELKKVLTQIYDRFKFHGHDVFAVKNNQLEQILAEYEIPFVYLDSLKCPSTIKLRREFGDKIICDRHRSIHRRKKDKKITMDPQCAVDKTALLWKWIRKQIVIGDTVH